ncbi:MAG: hypothetical protein U9R05_02650 [Chloroflexota bacterium]|nr:hypothetical protein [Chloroflexota bacterium]
MDHRETFVLTLFCDPQRSAEPRGRLRHIANNKEATFKSLEELARLLRRFAIDEKETRDDKQET